MSAEGLRDLKDAYTDLKIDTKAVGRGLGIWSERFHERVRAMEMSRDPVHDPALNATCKTLYNGLEKVAEKYGFDVEVREKVDVGLGSRLSDRHEGCCNGNFQPGNVLLNETCTGASKEKFDMAVVDWEMIRMGSNVTYGENSPRKPYFYTRLVVNEVFCEVFSKVIGQCGIGTISPERSMRPFMQLYI